MTGIQLNVGELWEIAGERHVFEQKMGNGFLLFRSERSLAPYQIPLDTGGFATPTTDWLRAQFTSGVVRRLSHPSTASRAQQVAAAREDDFDAILARDPRALVRQVVLNALDRMAEQAGGVLKASEASSETAPDQMHAFREEFEALLDAAEIDQLVVLIDDLDRCLPETAIATLEAIRLFLFVPRTAFVIAADEAMIEYSVRRHFPELPATTGPMSYARNYLEKLIQVPFRIPALGLAETRAYVTLLLAQRALGEDAAEFQKLLAAAREDLRRPWNSRGLDRTLVQGTLEGAIPVAVEDALRISGQITRLLTDGTRGNPRQIKRFLNSMALRRAIAEERGFGEDIDLPVLAKLMLAERFAPDLYDQVSRLASTATDGKVGALGALEAAAKAPPKPVVGQTNKPRDKGDAIEVAASMIPPRSRGWIQTHNAEASSCAGLTLWAWSTEAKRGCDMP